MGQALDFCRECDTQERCCNCADLHNWIMEHLETGWTSVAQQKPDAFLSVQGYMPDADPFPCVRECYRVENEKFFVPALNSIERVTHWKPMSEPPGSLQTMKCSYIETLGRRAYREHDLLERCEKPTDEERAATNREE